MTSYSRSAALRKAREKQQRRDERIAAEKQVKQGAAIRRALAEQARAFAASGCETQEEFTELKRAENEQLERAKSEREERQRSYVAPFVELEQGLPDALDVAFALSQRHAGRRPVSQAALLVESGLADDESEAARLCKSRKGKDLVACLRQLHWRRRRMGHGYEWVPPKRKERE